MGLTFRIKLKMPSTIKVRTGKGESRLRVNCGKPLLLPVIIVLKYLFKMFDIARELQIVLFTIRKFDASLVIGCKKLQEFSGLDVIYLGNVIL